METHFRLKLKIRNLISVGFEKLFNFNFSENARSQRFS